MPYLLRQDMNPNVWTVRASKEVDFSRFLQGKRIDAPTEPICLELAESKVRSDLLEFPYFIVSPALREELESYGVDNVDWYSVTLIGPDGEHPAWLGNVLASSSTKASKKKAKKKVKKKAKSFAEHRRRAIDLGSDAHLFRPNTHQALIAISDELKEHLASTFLEGLYFQDPTKYEGGPVSSYWEDDDD